MTTPASRWIVVREVISSTADGAMVMSALPGLVSRLIEEDAWREFAAPGASQPVRHETFSSFIRSEPPRGLGGRESQLLALCGKDEALAGKVRSLLRAEVPAVAAPGEFGRGRDRACGTNSKVQPDRIEHIIGRLKRDNPELAERVVAGDISPNAAALQMGWRHPRIVVSSPESVAEGLRRHMSPEDRARLVELLSTQ